MSAQELSDAELEKVRVFGLDRKPRIFDGVEGMRAGFVILGGIVLFALAVGLSAFALLLYGLGAHP